MEYTCLTIRYWTRCRWPHVAAAWSGVHFSLSSAFTLAPKSISSFIISSLSSMQHWKEINKIVIIKGTKTVLNRIGVSRVVPHITLHKAVHCRIFFNLKQTKTCTHVCITVWWGDLHKYISVTKYYISFMRER